MSRLLGDGRAWGSSAHSLGPNGDREIGERTVDGLPGEDENVLRRLGRRSWIIFCLWADDGADLVVAGVLGEPQYDEADELAALAGERPSRSKAADGGAGMVMDDDMTAELRRKAGRGTWDEMSRQPAVPG